MGADPGGNMGIYTDQLIDHSHTDNTDVLGKRWGVFNVLGTSTYEILCYRLEDNKVVTDRRIPAPEECQGVYTKREWAVQAINTYLARLNEQTEKATIRKKNANIREARMELEEANAAATS
jgi:hypothetical protein